MLVRKSLWHTKLSPRWLEAPTVQGIFRAQELLNDPVNMKLYTEKRSSPDTGCEIQAIGVVAELIDNMDNVDSAFVRQKAVIFVSG